jgi:predicted aconitase
LKHDVHPQPQYGEHIAWGESNAVVFANSVIGAKTIKYPDYLDICAALVGRVPEYGMHMNENRQPTILLDVGTLTQKVLPSLFSSEAENHCEIELDAFYPLLGYVCGALSESHVPLVVGLESCSITTDQLKSFSAAFGTTGSTALFHIAGITPEAKMNNNWEFERSALPCKHITLADIQNAFRTLDSGGIAVDTETSCNSNVIDLVAFGNPHLSLTECSDLAKMIRSLPTHAVGDNRLQKENSMCRKHSNVKVVATLGRSVFEEATRKGYIEPMTRFGFEFINDTCWCMLTEPVVPVDPGATIMTNSGKYAHYAPALVSKRVRFGSMAACLKAAQTGTISSSAPRWLLHNASTAMYPRSGQQRGFRIACSNRSVIERRYQNAIRKFCRIISL